MKKLFLLVSFLFFSILVAMPRLGLAAGTSGLVNATTVPEPIKNLKTLSTGMTSTGGNSAMVNAPAPIKDLRKNILNSGPQTEDDLETKAISHFEDAVTLMQNGKYGRSLSEFRASRQGLPFLADYILYFEASVSRSMKNDAVSAKYLDRLLKKHPKSPLVSKAKLMAIGMATDKDTLISLLGDFTKHYRGHDDMELRLAQLLKEKGDNARAGQILEKLYVQAGDFSGAALAELGRQPTTAEALARVENLLRRGNPEEAEREVLLLPDDPADMNEKLDLIGGALFMQKRYGEAASIYAQAADLYQAGRSYYRAADEEDLKKSIDGLTSAKDKRASYLIMDLASIERRNDHNFAGAITDLQAAAEKYPWVEEDATWETAWLYYLQRDYKDAANGFSGLASQYEEPEYLYWAAKSLEGLGGIKNTSAAMGLYRKLVHEDEGYYSVLASIKTGIPIKEETLPDEAIQQLKNSRAYMRFRVLTLAGLKDEALSDLAYSARNSMNRNTLVWIADQLKEMGAFRNAIAVAMRLPGVMQPRNVMYPHAFWGRVEKDCSLAGLDPYLVLSVMREESHFDPKVCSPVGAIGLMQLMPKTAKKYSGPLRIVIKNRNSIYSIDVNVEVGTFYLKKLYNDFKAIPPTLAAYNAGESIVRKWLAQGNYASFDEFVEDIPYDETKNYIKRIITTYYKYGGEDAAKGFFLSAKAGNS